MSSQSEQLTLASLRKRSNLTQRQIADLLNVTVTTVSAWERGTQVPRLTFVQVETLMSALGCTIRELVKATEKKEME